MARTQNGWLHLSTPQLEAKYLTTITVPGTSPVRRFRVRKGNVAVVFAWFAQQFDTHVESLNEGHPNDDWSFADRPIRSGSSTSNHASGTAVDFNATQHPLGTSPYANFTARQRSNIQALLHRAQGVIRWGGNYSGRKDPMHFEINASASRVAELADWIRANDMPAKPQLPPKDGLDAMTHYYADVKAMSLPEHATSGGVPTFLEFDRSDRDGDNEYKGLVGPGDADGQECVVTIRLKFRNDELAEDVTWGQINVVAYDDKGKLHYDFGPHPFPLSRWPSRPGREAAVTLVGKVYRGMYLRFPIEVSKALRLEGGRAEVLIKE